ncbi:MAG TPA: hypothetical protein VLA92_00360 [Candidatus Saccharimonadales bacterium]|nr:hypothetical protein [Candidatus Saccharimonadales bacterium]
MKSAPERLRKTDLLQDPLAYVDYIGRRDRVTTERALRDGGVDTILRLCVAPLEQVPLRALGYVAAAEYIQQEYFPRAELQIVAPIHTLQRVNGATSARSGAHQLFEAMKFRPMGRGTGTVHTRLMFDRPDPPLIDPGRIICVMRDKPEVAKLKAQADRRDSDFVPYLQAHLGLHDTFGSVQPAFPERDTVFVPNPRRLISIGGRFERVFYDARMRCRDTNVFIPGMVEETGQVITKHSLPGYLPARNVDFDPKIQDFMAVRDARVADAGMLTGSVVMDLGNLHDLFMAGFAAHGISTN